MEALVYIYIYYYTPLPLNLANKQQQQQARHHSVLATAPCQRLGLDSTLAILEPRWWPWQIQVLSRKLTGGGPGRGRQVGRCPPKSAQLWAKNSHFSPKTAIVRVQNSQTKANGCYPHVRLDFLVTKGPLVPPNSTICPRNGPKRRQKALETAQCAPAPRNQERAVSWATWLKNEFRGHLAHPQPPTFYGFHASESPNETRRPPYQWSLAAAGGPASPRTVGANGGSTRVPRAKKIIFSKVVPRPLGMLKKGFLGRFEPVVVRFGPWKIPKCLQNGPFWDQQCVKNGSKTRFSKNDFGPFMMLKQVVLAHFEPVATGFGTWKIPKCLENGPFWDSKMSQKRVKNAFFQK